MHTNQLYQLDINLLSPSLVTCVIESIVCHFLCTWDWRGKIYLAVIWVLNSFRSSSYEKKLFFQSNLQPSYQEIKNASILGECCMNTIIKYYRVQILSCFAWTKSLTMSTIDENAWIILQNVCPHPVYVWQKALTSSRISSSVSPDLVNHVSHTFLCVATTYL